MTAESVVADATQNLSFAEVVAQHLVEVEGINALVGPNAISAALPISQSISGTPGIPTISPSATSPQLTEVDDNGYFFRTEPPTPAMVLSSHAQPVGCVGRVANGGEVLSLHA